MRARRPRRSRPPRVDWEAGTLAPALAERVRPAGRGARPLRPTTCRQRPPTAATPSACSPAGFCCAPSPGVPHERIGAHRLRAERQRPHARPSTTPGTSRACSRAARAASDVTGPKYGLRPRPLRCLHRARRRRAAPAPACCSPPRAQGSEMSTVDGLTPEDARRPAGRRFVEASAVQCGYCTPGFIVAATAFLASTPEPARTRCAATSTATSAAAPATSRSSTRSPRWPPAGRSRADA